MQTAERTNYATAEDAADKLQRNGYTAYQTADGLLTHEIHMWGESDGTCTFLQHNRVFPIVAGRVDMNAIAAFIGH